MIISLKKLRNVIAILFLAIALLVTIILIATNLGKSNRNAVTLYPNNESRIAYLNLCGWQVDEDFYEEKAITIPSEFNDTYTQYNELQKIQGFDLSKYKGKQAVQYTYSITNYPGENSNIKAVLILYDDKIIGGDIHSTEVHGFMTGLKEETLY